MPHDTPDHGDTADRSDTTTDHAATTDRSDTTTEHRATTEHLADAADKAPERRDSAGCRLDSFLGKSGLCSRRKAKLLVTNGEIQVNGHIVRDPGHRIDPSRDRIMHENKPVKLPTEFVYYALHKPVKVESSNRVGRQVSHRRTCLSLLNVPKKEQLFSMGRLDYLSSGLLLFTNDGELCYRLTHPSFEIPKVYRVKTATKIDKAQLEAWKRGVVIEEIRYTLRDYVLHSEREMELHLIEGKNREIRRVCAHYSLRILSLCRTQFAGIPLAPLTSGNYRSLSQEEVAALRVLAKL